MTTAMDDPRSTSKNGGDALLLSSQTKYKHASLFVFRRRRRRRIAGISNRSDSQQLLEKQRRMGSMTATVSSAAAPTTAGGSSTIITTGLLGTAVGAKQPRKFPRDWLQKLVHGAAVDNDTTNNNNSNNMPRRPIYVVAPMVDQSDLPFRLQCRKYGAHLCFTPMIHAKLFATQKKYRQKFSIRTDIANLDRPLIAQLCGSDIQHVIETALAIQKDVDGIDINCGCPQQIAKRGHYGAFLLEDPIHLVSLVSELSTRLSIPVSVKVRLLPQSNNNNAMPDVPRSLALYRQLIDAGASMLTIHARTRFQKGHDTGQADWEAIRIAVQEFGNVVPILANGNIGTADDVLECLQYTGADGVMSSEAILEYPPLFWPLVTDMTDANTTTTTTTTTAMTTTTTITRPVIPSVTLALEYLDYAERYPPDQQGQGNGFKTVRNHMHRFLHGALQQHTNVRDVLVRAKTLDELRSCIIALRDVHQYVGFAPVWYNRHRQQHSNNTCGTNKGSDTTASITTATTMAEVQKSKNEDAATTNTTMTAETEETSLGAEEENPGNNMAADNVDDMDGTDAGMEEEKEDSTTKRQKVE
jgi:tRNA-dihydrouridine synthase 1